MSGQLKQATLIFVLFNVFELIIYCNVINLLLNSIFFNLYNHKYLDYMIIIYTKKIYNKLHSW